MKTFQTENNANNIKLMDTVITKNGSDIGYLEGNTELTCSLSKYELKVGIPKFKAGQILQEFFNKIKAKALELTGDNFAFGMGVAESMLKVWDGTEEYDYYWKTSLSEQQYLEFQQLPGSSWEYILLDHKNVVSATDIPIITVVEDDKATSGTIKTEDIHYIVDYANGIIYNPLPSSSTIASKAKVRIKYKCVPAKGIELPLKRAGFVTWSGEVQVTGTDVSTNDKVINYMPKAEVSGGGLSTSADSAWGFDIEINAVDNPETPNYPLGYLDFIPAEV